ncbi:TonB-dependent receptor [Catenovulum sediminis]|uniref:TonB-dependent receptor n=1 Tax=Catenovulum sediminis TaxID=1740262 RepID=UPI0011800C61|nr:TonB-dependent receptor [Catenovulum sediminis]
MNSLKPTQVIGSIVYFLMSVPLNAAENIAQTKQSETIFEVIEVNAQKNRQNPQEVSVSLSALSNDAIQTLGYDNAAQIANQIPGVNISDIAGTPNNILISIRGASQNDFADHNESPNAVYVDEVYISALGGIGSQLYDLQQIEILRGPQGTLFGRNATGGLVHLITQKPSQNLSGYLEAEVGSFNRQLIEGAIGGGNSTIAARIAGQILKQDGYIKNRIGEDMISADRLAIRGQVLVTPHEDFNILFATSLNQTNDKPGSTYEHRAAYVKAQDHNRGHYLNAQDNLYDTCAGCDMFGYKDPDGFDVWSSDIDRTDSKTERDMWQHTIKLSWQMREFEFISLSDYQSLEKTYEEDCDGSPNPVCGFGTYQDSNQFSHEFRLSEQTGAFRWLLGANYLKITGDYENHLWVEIADYYPSSVYSLTTESKALFGQLEYDIHHNLVFTLGARITKDSRDMAYTNRLLAEGDRHSPAKNILLQYDDQRIFDRLTEQTECQQMGGQYTEDELTADFGGICDKTGIIDRSSGESFWSYKTALNYHPKDNMMWYASYSRGVKGGGYSAPFEAILKVEQLPYQHEIIDNYEIGFKSWLANHTLRLNSAVFYADYNDYQAFDLQGLTQVITNQQAYLRGTEFEALWLPADSWSLNIGIALLDAKMQDYILPDGSTMDTKLPQAPAYTFNAMLQKSWQISRAADIRASLDYSLTDEQYYSLANHPTTYENGYQVFNARLTYEQYHAGWSASFWLKNISNEKYATYGFDASGVFGYSFLSYAPPRTAGINFTYQFGI